MPRKYQTRKTRPEAFEHGLSSQQLSALRKVCTEQGFVAGLESARMDLNLKISLGSLHRWYHKDDTEIVLAGIATGAHMNAQISDAFKKNPAPDMATLVNVIKTLVMQLSVQGAANPSMLELANTLFKSALDYVKEQGKAEDRKLEREKFALLLKKAERADATEKVLTDDDLSPAEREQRIKEIYGRA